MFIFTIYNKDLLKKGAPLPVRMVEKMIVINNSKQRNVILKSDMYNEHELFVLYKSGYIFCLGSLCQNVDFETEYDIDRHMHTFRVPLRICKELKVRYNTQYDFYENVAITNDDMTLPVIL